MKKKCQKAKSKYEENLLLLEREVKNYKHDNFKKETRNIIKIKHFLKYFESCNNSFMNTPLNLVWPFNHLTQTFLEDISNFEYDDIIPKILQLLMGDFNGSTKKKKLANLRNPIQKICSFYFLPIKPKSNDNILFCLCLEGEYCPSSSIYLLSISSNWNYEEIAEEFLEKINNDKSFPLVEFDQNGLFLVDEILFSHKEKDELSGSIICYPLKRVNTYNNTVFKTTLIHKKMISLFNDANDFKDNELKLSIINQIEDNQYDQRIISLIDGAKKSWQYKLSQQEKSYVKNSEAFILSGRPGTGKTTVILFKLFSIYFNYLLKKNQRIEDKIKKNKFNNIISDNKVDEISEPLRVVFTSLSQPLCEKQQNIFEETLVRKVDDSEFSYNPISSQSLKLASSFRNLSTYPIFVNFRKIMFMIDGSLTFQFFSRHNLTTYEGDHDTEFFYSKDYNYEVNQYSSDKNNKYLNLFYRNPTFINTIYLKESDKNTFISFYKHFLSKRKTIPLAQTLYNLKLNPVEIYAQLISVIKGSYSSHLYMNNCISKEDYKSKGRKLTDLPNLEDIYDVCMLYEEYKKGKYFDIQDLANFLIYTS